MAGWNDTDRELSYTAICEAVSAAGRDREVAFLARLALLLSEELADPDAIKRCLSAAALPSASS